MKAKLLICFLLVYPALYVTGQVDYALLDERDDVYYYQGAPYTGQADGLTENTAEPMRLQFVNGVAQGIYYGYYDDERSLVKWKVPMADGKMNGRYVHWNPDGTILFSANMLNGELEGLRRCYHDTGELWHVHSYKKGMDNGVRWSYYKNGNLWEEVWYRDGLQHGRYRGYYSDGSILSRGRYRKGEQHGRWKFYNEEGSLKGVAIFKNGEETSREIK